MLINVIDFETTGLPLHPSANPDLQPRAIEFAVVTLDGDGTEVFAKSWLINPERKLEPIITKITGITDAMLEGQPTFKEVFPEILSAFQGVDAAVAHNLPFDSFIMDHEVKYNDLRPAFPWPRHMLCTVQLFEDRYGYRPKLPLLFEDITGHKYPQTHRALDDVRALAEVIIQGDVIDVIPAA